MQRQPFPRTNPGFINMHFGTPDPDSLNEILNGSSSASSPQPEPQPPAPEPAVAPVAGEPAQMKVMFDAQDNSVIANINDSSAAAKATFKNAMEIAAEIHSEALAKLERQRIDFLNSVLTKNNINPGEYEISSFSFKNNCMHVRRKDSDDDTINIPSSKSKEPKIGLDKAKGLFEQLMNIANDKDSQIPDKVKDTAMDLMTPRFNFINKQHAIDFLRYVCCISAASSYPTAAAKQADPEKHAELGDVARSVRKIIYKYKEHGVLEQEELDRLDASLKAGELDEVEAWINKACSPLPAVLSAMDETEHYAVKILHKIFMQAVQYLELCP
jgi:hypothetical protein